MLVGLIIYYQDVEKLCLPEWVINKLLKEKNKRIENLNDGSLVERRCHVYTSNLKQVQH